MITDIFRLDDNVPRIYVNESRDFQMLCRLFTYALNSPKYEAETLHYLNSGMLTNDRLLTNLCEKTGFMDGESIKGEYLRYITENFGRLVRDKGAATGICNAVYLYLLMYNLSTACYVQIDRKTYTIHIGIKSAVKDIQVLYTILKYIVPTGWLIDIFFYAEMKIWQGYAYKDTFVNMVRKASATNALYIINTMDGYSQRVGDGDVSPIVGRVGGLSSENAVSYESFGSPSSTEEEKGTTHITKYTGSIAINAMSSSTIESFMDNPEQLIKHGLPMYGTELWDARGYLRFGDNKYKRNTTTGRRVTNNEDEG